MRGILKLFILPILIFTIINATNISSDNNYDDKKSNNNFLDNNKDDLETSTNTKSSDDNKTIESNKDIVDYEFIEYKDMNLLQSLIERFSIHDETYLLPVYYAIEPLPKPISSRNNIAYNRLESKFQVSFKLLVSRDLFYGIGFYFAYTQNVFFQIYSPKLSSPFRDSDFTPELVLYKPLNISFLAGELYNIRFGYSHTSNGEGLDSVGFIKSRGMDRVFSEFMYKIDDFKLALKLWVFTRREPRNIIKYMGFSSLKLSYDLYNHHFILNVSNLIHNYLKYKGNVRLEYRYDIFDKVGLYAQYFYGYGDNLYQYNIKSHHIGLGIAIAH